MRTSGGLSDTAPVVGFIGPSRSLREAVWLSWDPELSKDL